VKAASRRSTALLIPSCSYLFAYGHRAVVRSPVAMPRSGAVAHARSNAAAVMFVGVAMVFLRRDNCLVQFLVVPHGAPFVPLRHGVVLPTLRSRTTGWLLTTVTALFFVNSEFHDGFALWYGWCNRYAATCRVWFVCIPAFLFVPGGAVYVSFLFHV